MSHPLSSFRGYGRTRPVTDSVEPVLFVLLHRRREPLPLGVRTPMVPLDHLLCVPARSRSPNTFFACGRALGARARNPFSGSVCLQQTRDLSGPSHPRLSGALSPAAVAA